MINDFDATINKLNESILNSSEYKTVSEFETFIKNDNVVTTLIENIKDLQEQNVITNCEELIEIELTKLYNNELYSEYIKASKELDLIYNYINDELNQFFMKVKE